MNIPNNTLTERIKKYFEIINQIGSSRCKSELFPPKTLSQISEFELNNNIHIPDSYKEWLTFSNGGRL